MSVWLELYREVFWWLPIAFATSGMLLILILIVKALMGMRRHRKVSQDVTKAYRYFKRLLERLDKDDEKSNRSP